MEDAVEKASTCTFHILITHLYLWFPIIGKSLSNRYHFCTKHKLNSTFGILCTQHSRKFLIHAAQNFIKHLYHSNLYTQTIEERCKLDANHSTTDNGK